MEKQNLPNSTLILVMGILSIVGCCCYGLPGLIFGIVAIVLGQKSTNIYKMEPEKYTGFENVKAGKVMGIIGVVLSILATCFILWIIVTFGWEAMQDPELMQQRMEELQRGS